MGMYAEIDGVDIKFTGLLSHIAVERAMRGEIEGHLEVNDEGMVTDSYVALTKSDVTAIVVDMRFAFLDGSAARRCSRWSEPPKIVPLGKVSDVRDFYTDVIVFHRLVEWLGMRWHA